MFDLIKNIAVICGLGAAIVTSAKADELGPTLQKIKDSGSITIGHRDTAIPVSYLNAEQKPVGFALDLCALIAEKVKQRLDLPELKSAYRLATPQNSVSMLGEGAIDIDCAATPNTPDLQQQAGFSAPIYASELRWLAPRNMRTEIDWFHRRDVRIVTSGQDLRWKTVVLIQGSPAIPIVLSLSNDRTLGLSILEAKDSASAFKLLEARQAWAFMDDDLVLIGLKASARNQDTYIFLEDEYAGNIYSFLLRKGDQAFKSLVDGALSEAMSSGEFAKIYSKWFESPIPAKNINLAYPMTRAMKQLVKDPRARSASYQN